MADNYRFGSTFGSTLRALREQYHYSTDYRAWVRMAYVDDDHELVRVEICPTSEILTASNEGNAGRSLDFLIWNEDPKIGKAIMSSLQIPKEKFTSYTSFMVNMDGQIVK